MTILEILTAYFNLLWSSFQWDIHYLSQPWMYFCLLIPAICYLVFFFVKWIVLTVPIWLPFRLIFSGIGNLSFKLRDKKNI